MSINEMNFSTRETYIAWRANWRSAYSAISTEIRQTKNELANAFRMGDLSKAATLQRDLLANRALATRLLDLRKEAKKKSGEQRAVALQKEQAEAA